jgi:hypothetical protein
VATWYTAEDGEQVQRIRGAWVDAPVQNVELLQMLLDVAREQVIAFAPAPAPVPPGEPVPGPPPRYVLAQLMQVRNLWNAGRTTGDGEVGPEGFTFRPYPLDNTIKAVIRPIDWKPDVY